MKVLVICKDNKGKLIEERHKGFVITVQKYKAPEGVRVEVDLGDGISYSYRASEFVRADIKV